MSKTEILKYELRDGAGFVTHEIGDDEGGAVVASLRDGWADPSITTFATHKEARQRITDSMAEIGAKRVHENVDTPETKAAALLEKRIGWWQESIDKWHAAFADDPKHALEWAGRVYHEVAHVHVATEALLDLERGALCTDVGERLQRDINRDAGSPSRSTSICANLLNADFNAARVEVRNLLVDRRLAS